MDLRIDPELQALIPPLSAEERALLEESIVREGCRDPLVVWGDTLVDGFTRIEICRRRGIPYATTGIQFESREDARVWMRNNQLGRRNLSDAWRIELQLGTKEDLLALGAAKRVEAGTDARAKQLGVLSENDRTPDAHSTRDELARAVGVSSGKLAMAEQVRKHAPELWEKAKRDEVKITAAYQQMRRETKKLEAAERGQSFSDRLDAAPQKYRILYADPPWKYREEQHAEIGAVQETVLGSHYPSMSVDQLCLLPVKEIAEDDAVLFLWVTSPLLEECFEVIRAWGFRYKASMVWDKVKHNVGHYVSVRHELLLICTRGAATPDNRRLYDSVQSIERTTHSRKPEEFRHIIDDIYRHGARIELFARGAVPAPWVAWGNEASV